MTTPNALSDEQIMKIWCAGGTSDDLESETLAFARAIEAAVRTTGPAEAGPVDELREALTDASTLLDATQTRIVTYAEVKMLRSRIDRLLDGGPYRIGTAAPAPAAVRAEPKGVGQ